MDKKILSGAEPLFIDGNKYGVLLLHGFTGSPYEMKPLADLFAAKGYSISLPLLSGHGTIEEDLIDCKWYDWFQDAKKSLFDLRKKCEKIVAIGLSVGGSLALHLAAHYQVEGVIALAPGLYFKEKKTKLLPFTAPFLRYCIERGGPDIKDDNERVKAVSYKRTPIKAAMEVLKLFRHLKIDLPDIYSPVFLAHSKNDHVIDYKSSETIYAEISSMDKRFLKLEKSYHVLTLDVEKEVLFREIQKFTEHLFKE